MDSVEINAEPSVEESAAGSPFEVPDAISIAAPDGVMTAAQLESLGCKMEAEELKQQSELARLKFELQKQQLELDMQKCLRETALLNASATAHDSSSVRSSPAMFDGRRLTMGACSFVEPSRAKESVEKDMPAVTFGFKADALEDRLERESTYSAAVGGGAKRQSLSSVFMAAEATLRPELLTAEKISQQAEAMLKPPQAVMDLRKLADKGWPSKLPFKLGDKGCSSSQHYRAFKNMVRQEMEAQ